jgi:hypothetical protein
MYVVLQTHIVAHIDLGPVRQQHLGNLGLVELCGPVERGHPALWGEQGVAHIGQKNGI